MAKVLDQVSVSRNRTMSPDPPRRCGIAGQVILALAGAAIWGGLFYVLGMMGNRAPLGAFCGAAVGAVTGLEYARGRIGPVVPWMTVFAFLGAVLGPACDADALSSALWGAGIGAFLGATGLRGLLALVGCLVGVNVGVLGGEFAAWFGLFSGAVFGWWIGHVLPNLRYLSLCFTQVTDEGVERLRKALPECHIDYEGRAPIASQESDPATSTHATTP